MRVESARHAKRIALVNGNALGCTRFLSLPTATHNVACQLLWMADRHRKQSKASDAGQLNKSSRSCLVKPFIGASVLSTFVTSSRFFSDNWRIFSSTESFAINRYTDTVFF